MAIQRGDISGAKEQYEALKSNGSCWLSCRFICFGRLLGLLSNTMGELDQAVSHFEDALAFCRKAGYRPELAWTTCDYADTLLQRSETGDREKAMSLLDESLDISTQLGIRPLMGRVLSRRDILKA